jgi:hypothetical protein
MHRRFRPRLPFANVAATLALVLAASGLAVAATPQSSKVIRACAKKSNGALRLISKGSCRKSEKAVSWSQTGPQGPAGVAGAAGAAGAKGDPGTPATKLFAQVKSNGTLNTGSPGVLTTRAATGTYLLSFPEDISHCVALVNQGAIPIFTTPASNTGSVTGHAHAVLTSAGGTYPGGYPTGQTVVVVTQNGSNVDTDADFTVAVLC